MSSFIPQVVALAVFGLEGIVGVRYLLPGSYTPPLKLIIEILNICTATDPLKTSQEEGTQTGY